MFGHNHSKMYFVALCISKGNIDTYKPEDDAVIKRNPPEIYQHCKIFLHVVEMKIVIFTCACWYETDWSQIKCHLAIL